MISNICEAFGCTTTQAKQEDPALVRAVFDYRNAQTALEWMQEVAQGGEAGERAAKRLEAHPELGNLLLEMHRAQQESS